jgi:hypothetical protein
MICENDEKNLESVNKNSKNENFGLFYLLIILLIFSDLQGIFDNF